MGTKKIIQILNYLASIQPNREIDEMKAYKLIWLIDRYHLRQYGRTVTGDSYNSMPLGVVPSDAKCIVNSERTKLDNDAAIVREYISKPRNHKYVSLKDSNMKVFSESDMNAIKVILDVYGNKGYNDLSELSHKFPEWKYYEARIIDKKKKNSYKIDMNLFFENYDDGSGLFMDSTELLDLTKGVYHQYKGF